MSDDRTPIGPPRVPGGEAAGDGASDVAGRLRIGLNLPTWPVAGGRNATWAEMRALALEAEALGIDTLWAPDHLQRRVPDRPVIGFWECWTIVTATAAVTSTIEVGPFVACTGFRNPGLLARMATTLDEVSGGRVILGLGSGVPATDESWRAFGYDGASHVSRHAESVEAISRLLREGRLTYEGSFVRMDGAEVVPSGPRPGGPPIWVAAKGDRTLGIAARFADAVNVNMALTGPAEAAAQVDRVADACRAAGRDPATLAVTGWARLALRPDGSAVPRPGWIGGAPAEVATTLREIRGAGIAHLTLYPSPDDDPSPLPALTRDGLGRLRPVLEALDAR
jgi:alkanesulfonate monooxygenase SsuD/methylene tetrahydromethanopterin reductase-like flavin-dependent oxidoreductase (luciferase family)